MRQSIIDGGDVLSITIDDVVDSGNFYIGSRRIIQRDFYRNIQIWLKKRAQLHENRVLFDLN